MNAASRTTLSLLAALAFGGLAAAPARAGDDGQASLITGLATTFGLTREDQPTIDYRERAKLVVPRNKTLPPPAPASGDAAWPVDNEVQRDRAQKKIEAAEPSAREVSNPSYQLFHPGQDIKVTTSSFDRHGPACRVPDPKTGLCPDAPRPTTNWNPLTWVGLEKKPQVQLGAEPERENLVDPPKGYRAPAEGVGAKVDD